MFALFDEHGTLRLLVETMGGWNELVEDMLRRGGSVHFVSDLSSLADVLADVLERTD